MLDLSADGSAITSLGTSISSGMIFLGFLVGLTIVLGLALTLALVPAVLRKSFIDGLGSSSFFGLLILLHLKPLPRL